MRLTRREFGGLAVGTLAGGLVCDTAMAAAAVATALAPGAIDCHIHIVGPQSKYPMAANRSYTPPEASVAQLKALRTQIGVSRNVIVQPSFYGFDNSCTRDAVVELGPSARGIAVVRPDVSDAELRRLDAAGFVGIRLNFSTLGITDPREAERQVLEIAPKLEPLRWHIQINTELPMIAALAPIIGLVPVPVVFDHIGNPEAELGVAHPGFFALMELVHNGNAYVKLSAPYNHSKLADWADVAPLAKSLIGTRPDRMLWGTNWPHPAATRGPLTQISPYQRIDNPKLVAAFMEWCSDAAMRRMILVDTPARLYRFPAA
jgi:predicted TIM-barrel fold metal-dependent hydrolase